MVGDAEKILNDIHDDTVPNKTYKLCELEVNYLVKAIVDSRFIGEDPNKDVEIDLDTFRNLNKGLNAHIER